LRRRTAEIDRVSWLAFAQYPFGDLVASGTPAASFKMKDASLRRGLNARQAGVVWNYLTRTDADVPGALLAGHPGRADQRGGARGDRLWPARRDHYAGRLGRMARPAAEARHLAWVRQCYAALFAETGGVSAPGAAASGALINHPMRTGRSGLEHFGVPWHAFYYQDNYPRLQQVKARWDPLNIFHTRYRYRQRKQ